MQRMKLSNLKYITAFLILLGCRQEPKRNAPSQDGLNLKPQTTKLVVSKPPNLEPPVDMVWIKGGTFYQGALPEDSLAMQHEKPRHKVTVNGFYMDMHEVTNDQFAEFVAATNYVTVAERAISWDEMKKQLPPETPKPHDSILQPGSLVFKKSKSSLPNLYDYSQWWEWKIGANWRHPNGPGSSIEGKGKYPVVQIAYEDALAYCEWKGGRLPTEAEWEYAARAEKINDIYSWPGGLEQLSSHANTWEGEFPVENKLQDGYERRAPVKSYPANAFGLYDMAGNVWEWTSDWYHVNYYANVSEIEELKNPSGPEKAYNPSNPYVQEKVIKGGSFLCSASYCASYRISARMATGLDSGAEHLGFRTVLSVDKIENK
nr:formylglycine-generating enzyme family protein [Croceivirga radicis]